MFYGILFWNYKKHSISYNIDSKNKFCASFQVHFVWSTSTLVVSCIDDSSEMSFAYSQGKACKPISTTISWAAPTQ
jgi:hypothetical protein